MDNIEKKWNQEIEHHCPKTPKILVGCKKDLRDQQPDRGISEAEGKALADKIGAAGYVECSALTGDKVDEVFNTAIRVHMQPPGKEKKKKERKCFIL